jgi:UDP-N-acetylmuramoylalanine--D-glutamate ligase
VLFYSTRGRDDGWVEKDDLAIGVGDGVERYPISSLNLVGRHNLGNTLAALLLMRGAGLATEAQAQKGLRAFQPLPHRMQLVGVRRGVRFYDDSKATNVDSVVAGLDGFPMPFVLIAGGRDKGGSYDPLVRALGAGRCRGVIVIGEAAGKIAAAVGTQLPLERAVTLEEAVERGALLALKGDAVVLSPGCSSYDMFDNYEHRGRVFCSSVEGLPK